MFFVFPFARPKWTRPVRKYRSGLTLVGFGLLLCSVTNALPVWAAALARGRQTASGAHITVIVKDTMEVILGEPVQRIIVVSPEIASVQLKNPTTLVVAGLQVGETIVIASNGARRLTYTVAVIGRTAANTKRTGPAAALAAKPTGLSGSYSFAFIAPLDSGPAVLQQSVELRRVLAPDRTLRFSGNMFNLRGQGDPSALRAAALGFGINRIILGLESATGSLDLLDSSVNLSSLTLDNYAVRGLHLVSRPNSRFRGLEFFAGMARPSSSLFQNPQGWVAGGLLPVVHNVRGQVRAGVLLGLARGNEGSGAPNGLVGQIDGRYLVNRSLSVDGEANLSAGGLSWRASANLRQGPFVVYGEAARSSARSPLVAIGAQSGARATEAVSFQWRPSSRFSTGFNYNHSAIVPAANAPGASLDRITLRFSARYQLTANSRVNFRYTQQKIETVAPGGAARFEFATRAATANYQLRLGTHWSNNFEGRLNFSREQSSQAPLEQGFGLSDQLRFSWRGGSAIGYLDYGHRAPSLEGVIVRNPALLPPDLHALFLADPVRFLQNYRDELARLLPGIELPLASNFAAGVRLQTSISRFMISSEIRYGANETLGSSQRELSAALSTGIRLDAANAINVNARQSFAGGGGHSALTIGYSHRFGDGAEDGFQFTRLLGLDRGAVRGTVFFDRNGNGQQDEGEAGVPAMKLQLDGGRTVTTNVNGHYEFKAPAGEHHITLTSPRLGVSLKASGATDQPVTVTARETLTVSFGVSDFGGVGGRIYNDLALTGGPATDDLPGVTGVRLFLKPSAAMAEATSVTVLYASGNYQFNNLPPGDYTLELDPESLPANYKIPAQTKWPLKVSPLQNAYQDIPLTAQRGISGIVFLDKNENSKYDETVDELLEGVKVVAGSAETVSTKGGAYALRNLPAGKLSILAHWKAGVAGTARIVTLGAEPVTVRKIDLAVKP